MEINSFWKHEVTQKENMEKQILTYIIDDDDYFSNIKPSLDLMKFAEEVETCLLEIVPISPKVSTLQEIHNPNLKIAKEELKYKITLESCELYLKSHYPDKLFTKEQITRCEHIFKTIMTDCNFYEIQKDECHVGVEGYDGTVHAIFGGKTLKEELNRYLMFHPILIIICDEVNEVNVMNENKPIYKLIELLESESAYEIFCNYYDNIPVRGYIQ